MDNQNDSMLIDSPSQHSNFTDSPAQNTSDSFSSYQSNDQLTCYSENNMSNSINDSLFAMDKPFSCSFDNCNKSFKLKWTLDKHTSAHKPPRIYRCSYKGCLKSYKSKENLTLHIRNIHLKEKPYSCRYCPSVFSHRNGKLISI